MDKPQIMVVEDDYLVSEEIVRATHTTIVARRALSTHFISLVQ